MIIAPMAVNFLGIKVNTLDNSSLVSVGPNLFIDQLISYKRNQGFGEQSGDLSPINISISYIFDPDVNDSNTIKNSVI